MIFKSIKKGYLRKCWNAVHLEEEEQEEEEKEYLVIRGRRKYQLE